MHISSPPISQNVSSAGGKTYHCGTLIYTKAGLVALFVWLLWGDFCFTLMEAVVPSIMPLKMKALGCPNWLMGTILTAMPSAISMTVGPYISFKSDRYRSRWGRRIPFILWSMPFLCVCLALLGFSDDLCILLQKNSEFLRQYSPAAITIALVVIFLILFKFFDMFVNSVFWYLFNDVVPAQFLSRFMGAFKIVGTGAGALYNCFVFQYAGTHMREILVGAALLYLAGFGVACLMIKEGQYPPPSEKECEESKGLSGFITFFRESFSHKFYWFRFLATSFSAVAWAASAFQLFFSQQMGLSLGQIGWVAGLSSVVQMLAMYFMSIFIDRWHPIRIITYGAVFSVAGYVTANVWIFVTLPGSYFFWLSMYNSFIGVFLSALTGVAGMPFEMRTFPKSRFGQFCSAQAMLRCAFTVVAGILCGLYFDIIKSLFNGSDFAYRFIYTWTTFFLTIQAVFLIYVYREWYRLGGDKNFHPPAPWSPDGVEEMPIVPVTGPQTKWLKVVFMLIDFIMALYILGTAGLMVWMYEQHKMLAFKWYGLAILPLEIAGLLLWLWLKSSIKQDIHAAQNRLPLKNGIPHHGMLVVFYAKVLLGVAVFVCQVVITIMFDNEAGAIVFGVANAVNIFLFIGILYLLCRIERGYSNVVDEKPEVESDSSQAAMPG